MSKNLTPEEKEAKILMNVLAQSQANLNQEKQAAARLKSTPKINIPSGFQEMRDHVVKNKNTYSGLTNEAIFLAVYKDLKQHFPEFLTDSAFQLVIDVVYGKGLISQPIIRKIKAQSGGKRKSKSRKRTSKKRKTRKASR